MTNLAMPHGVPRFLTKFLGVGEGDGLKQLGAYLIRMVTWGLGLQGLTNFTVIFKVEPKQDPGLKIGF